MGTNFWSGDKAQFLLDKIKLKSGETEISEENGGLFLSDNDGKFLLNDKYEIRNLENFKTKGALDYFTTSGNVGISDELVNHIDGHRSVLITQASALATHYAETDVMQVNLPIYKQGSIAYAFDLDTNADVDSFRVELIANDGSDRVVKDVLINATGNTRFIISDVTLEDADTTLKARIYTEVPNDANTLIVDNFRIHIGDREVKAFTVTNSINLSGNGNEVIPDGSTNIPYNGSGTGWDSVNRDYELQFSDSQVNIKGCIVYGGAVATPYAVLAVNGVAYRSISNSQIATSGGVKEYSYISSVGEFSKTDKLSIHARNGSLATDPSSHYLNIVETAQSSGTVYASDTNKEDIIVRGVNNTSQAITADVTDISWIEVDDSHSAWSGSAFTVPETGIYNINGRYSVTTATGGAARLFVNGAFDDYIGYDSVTKAYYEFTAIKKFLKNDVVSIRHSGSTTLNNADPDYHWINITKQSVNVDALIVENFGNVVAASTLGTGELENVFSGRINSDASIDSENSPFILSAIKNGSGDYTINFVADFFTVAPSIVVTQWNTSANRTVVVSGAPTTSGFNVRTQDTSNDVASDTPFFFTVQRQGSDYKSKANYIDSLIVENYDGSFETEEKVLLSNVSNVSDVTVFEFTGLNVGDTYTLTGQVTSQATGTAGQATLAYYNSSDNSVIVGSTGQTNFSTSAPKEINHGVSFAFTASYHTLRVSADCTNSSQYIIGDGSKRFTYLQVTKLPKKQGVDTLNQIVNNRPLDGSEYPEKGEFYGGKQLYSRTYVIASDITGTTDIATGLPSGINPYGCNNHIGTYWTIVNSAFSTDGSIITYDPSTNKIQGFITGAYKIGAGTTFTFKYTY